MAEDLGEKTEDPTPKRRSEAREKGDVARSQEVSAAVILIAALLVLLIFGGGLAASMATILRRTLAPDVVGGNITAASLSGPTLFSFWETVRMVAPVTLLLAGAAILSQIGQFGLLFTLKPLAPKLNRLDPIKGASKFIDKKKMMKGALDTVKFACIFLIVAAVCAARMPMIAALPSLTMEGAVVVSGRIMLEVTLWLLAVMLVIAVIDFVFQRWRHKEQLKMTKQEVKDERKSSEGDPQVKQRRFSLYQKLVLQQLQSAVPRADVIVTNPTHFAVALAYDAEKMGAPRVVAKGADHLAIRIRLLAASHGVPIIERPPLARGLYYGVEVGREVPVEHYEAVAEVLAYVYRLEGRAAS
ncbi:MAG: flagellar biosynthesis protein FlhB [Phycisphaerales bacterium]